MEEDDAFAPFYPSKSILTSQELGTSTVNSRLTRTSANTFSSQQYLLGPQIPSPSVAHDQLSPSQLEASGCEPPPLWRSASPPPSQLPGRSTSMIAEDTQRASPSKRASEGFDEQDSSAFDLRQPHLSSSPAGQSNKKPHKPWTQADDLALNASWKRCGPSWEKVTNDYNLSRKTSGVRSSESLRNRWHRLCHGPQRHPSKKKSQNATQAQPPSRTQGTSSASASAAACAPRRPPLTPAGPWTQEEHLLLRESLIRHNQSFDSTHFDAIFADYFAAYPDSTRSHASIQKRCREMYPLPPAPEVTAGEETSSINVGIILDGQGGVFIENCPRNRHVVIYSPTYVKISKDPPPSEVRSFGQTFRPVFHFHVSSDGALCALQIPFRARASMNAIPAGEAAGFSGTKVVDTVYRAQGYTVLFRSAR